MTTLEMWGRGSQHGVIVQQPIRLWREPVNRRNSQSRSEKREHKKPHPCVFLNYSIGEASRTRRPWRLGGGLDPKGRRIPCYEENKAGQSAPYNSFSSPTVGNARLRLTLYIVVYMSPVYVYLAGSPSIAVPRAASFDASIGVTRPHLAKQRVGGTRDLWSPKTQQPLNSVCFAMKRWRQVRYQ